MVAPVTLFAYLHSNAAGQMMQCKRITAVPISEDFQRQVLQDLGDETKMTQIIRGNNLNYTVYRGAVRPELIREIYQYLSSIGNIDGYRRVNDNEITDYSNMQGQADVNNLVDLSEHGNVILPDGVFSPGQENMPVWFLELSSPYAKTMPIFFPRQTGDWDDPRRDSSRPVTEFEWIGHILRSVHKELVEFPLFGFTAAYRMDMKCLQSAYNSCIGYRESPNGDMDKSDVDGQRFAGTVPGSSEYYEKHKCDIEAKGEIFSPPTLFVTLTNTQKWEVVLSTALSQDGWNIWHKNDERKRLRLLQGQEHPGEEEGEYFAHAPASNLLEDDCPYHSNCRRCPIQSLLGEEAKEKLLSRNTYNFQRIFCQRANSLIRNVLMSASSGIGGAAYHFLKEFGSGGGTAHSHGLVWQNDSEAKQAFVKMQEELPVSALEMDAVSALVDSTVTTSIDAANLSIEFPDLNGDRSRDIVELAKQVQSHTCGEKCLMENDTDGCYYHFPRLPTESTIICSPIKSAMGEYEARYLELQCRKVKISVRTVLKELKANGLLQNVTLTELLLQALGPVDDYGLNDASWYTFNHNYMFPQCPGLTRWIQTMRSLGKSYPIMHAVYYTALSTATWYVEGHLVYQLVLKRSVSEAYIVDYNPFLLEGMRSNMEVRYVTHTPHLLINYVTKAESKPNIEKVIADIRRTGGQVTGASIATQAQNYRKVSLPEAFFRIDTRLSLSNTNVQVVNVNTKFPHLRGSMYKQSQDGDFNLPGRDGLFKLLDGTLTKYAKRYFQMKIIDS